MSFSNNIKEWIKLDDEIKILNRDLKIKRENRNTLLSSIIEYKNNNNLDNKTIKYNSETFKFVKLRQYQNITYEHIKNCLNELIEDKEYVEIIINHIKNKRNYKNVDDIKRFYI